MYENEKANERVFIKKNKGKKIIRICYVSLEQYVFKK